MSNIKVELHNPDNADEKWLPKTCGEQVFLEDGTDVESAVTELNSKTKIKLLGTITDGSSAHLFDFTKYDELIFIISGNSFQLSITVPVMEITPATRPFYSGAYYNATNAYYAYVLINTGGVVGFKLLNATVEISDTTLNVYAR